MSGKHLLDTNIVIAFFRKDGNVEERMTRSKEVFVPVNVLGELYYGAQHSLQVAKRIQQVEDFKSNAKVLNCDSSTADIYGQIKNGLKLKGKPIPENDIWIAAIAFQHDLAVVTRDQHFKEIDGLTLEEW